MKSSKSKGGSKKSVQKKSPKKVDMNLHGIFINKLQSLYDTESELIKALPKMAKKATDPDLRAGLTEHLEETKEHAKRLEEIFAMFDEKPKKLKGEAIRGLAADADWVMKNVVGAEALDANLIAAGQYVEHYEMAGYGSALAWAREMGHEEAATLLAQTLEEEKAADEKLNDLALTKINENANESEQGEDMSKEEKEGESSSSN